MIGKEDTHIAGVNISEVIRALERIEGEHRETCDKIRPLRYRVWPVEIGNKPQPNEVNAYTREQAARQYIAEHMSFVNICTKLVFPREGVVVSEPQIIRVRICVDDDKGEK